MSFSDKMAPVFKVDGVDHVRISVHAVTLIGRMASHDYKYEFFIPHLGHFLSPVCFANWLSTGDDNARHDADFRVKKTIKGYRKYILFAKFWQLCKMRPRLTREKRDLPFVSYREHQSGIKELNRWKDYAPTVKLMLDHIFDPERGPHAKFGWTPGLLEEIDTIVSEIAEQQGFVPSPEKETPTGEFDVLFDSDEDSSVVETTKPETTQELN